MRTTLEDIEKRIVQACLKSGRSRTDVHLLAVSKLQSPEKIEEAYSLGLRDFGENYVQELVEKRKMLAHLKDIRWHLIGHLQSNKSKTALENSDFFHALDSEKLAVELSKKHSTLGLQKPYPVFIEVNLDGETSKAGVDPGQLGELIGKVTKLPQLKLRGLMCIPAIKPDMRPAFSELRSLAGTFGTELELSMGMSEDFETAIEEGSNWVRIGRRLFGERPQAK